MENILAMAEGSITSEITSFDQILIKLIIMFFKNCLQRVRSGTMNKGENEKKSLILKFYNHIVKGKA